eukprot:SAG31_NODE_1329_length_8753_cov_4.101225_3_plen_44_part_00
MIKYWLVQLYLMSTAVPKFSYLARYLIVLEFRFLNLGTRVLDI